VDSDGDFDDLEANEGLLDFPDPIDIGLASPGEDVDVLERVLEEHGEMGDSVHLTLPKSLGELQEKLLQGYSPAPVPPPNIPQPQTLSQCELLTLQHYVAWKRSNGTVKAYKLHAQVLQNATGTEIIALPSARKLAINLTDLRPSKVDICPHSCIAFTGEFQEMEYCPYV
jgi:hypothetical protein